MHFGVYSAESGHCTAVVERPARMSNFVTSTRSGPTSLV